MASSTRDRVSKKRRKSPARLPTLWDPSQLPAPNDRLVFASEYRRQALRRQATAHWTATIVSVIVGLCGVLAVFVVLRTLRHPWWYQALSMSFLTILFTAIVHRHWKASERADSLVRECYRQVKRGVQADQLPRVRRSKRARQNQQNDHQE